MIQSISSILVACSLASSVAVVPAMGQGTAPAAPAAPVDPGAAAESWPQHVSAGGSSYQVFRPRLTGLDGSRAYFVAEVSILAGGGAARTGEAEPSSLSR